jgi:hypothetical protein
MDDKNNHEKMSTTSKKKKIIVKRKKRKQSPTKEQILDRIEKQHKKNISMTVTSLQPLDISL